MKAKRTAAFLLALILILLSSFTASAAEKKSYQVKAKPVSAGYDELSKEYKIGKINGKTYGYYDPVRSSSDKVKYPVVVFVHGLFNGTTRDSFRKNGMTLWASAEMQGKWVQGGAHLLMPRLTDHATTTAAQIFSVIEGYIKAHEKNVDRKKIFIMGSSAGAAKAWNIILDHPDYFKGCVFVGCTKNISASEAKKVANIPIWMVSAETDPLVNIVLQEMSWNNICKYSKVRSKCRWSVFLDKSYYPEGKSPVMSHFMGKTIGYDFCFISNKQPYGNMKHVNGDGKTFKISWSHGIIDWMQTITR